jgi:hypothetical protein
MRIHVSTLFVLSLLAPAVHATETVSYGSSTLNPLTVSATVQRATDANAKGWACRAGRQFVTAQPVMELTVDKEVALTITADDGDWVMLFDGRFVCGVDLNSKKLRYSTGRTYQFYAGAKTKDAGAQRRTLTIVNDGGPRVFSADVPRQALPASLKAPYTQPLDLADGRDAAACGDLRFGAQPDLIVTSEAELKDVVIEAIAPSGTVGLQVLGPLAEGKVADAPVCAPARAGPATASFKGAFAVWVGGGDDAPDSITLRVRGATTKIDRFALTAITDDAPVSGRALERAFLNLDLAPLDDPAAAPGLSEAIWLKATKALVVFPAEDLTSETAEHAGPGERKVVVNDFPKKDEPLLVRRAKEKAEVLTMDGQRYSVALAKLVTAASGKPVLPKTPREPPGPTDEERLKNPPKKMARAVKAYDKSVAKETACYAKRFAKADKEKKASEADIARFHGGDIDEWAQAIDKKVRKACKSARVAKSRDKLLKKMKSAEAKPRKKSLKKVSKRVKKIIK